MEKPERSAPSLSENRPSNSDTNCTSNSTPVKRLKKGSLGPLATAIDCVKTIADNTSPAANSERDLKLIMALFLRRLPSSPPQRLLQLLQRLAFGLGDIFGDALVVGAGPGRHAGGDGFVFLE